MRLLHTHYSSQLYLSFIVECDYLLAENTKLRHEGKEASRNKVPTVFC